MLMAVGRRKVVARLIVCAHGSRRMYRSGGRTCSTLRRRRRLRTQRGCNGTIGRTRTLRAVTRLPRLLHHIVPALRNIGRLLRDTSRLMRTFSYGPDYLRRRLHSAFSL
jgi:hypothetical protein